MSEAEMMGQPEHLDAMPTDPAAFAPGPEGVPSFGEEPETPDYAALLAAERAEKERLAREAEQYRQQQAAWRQQQEQLAFQQAQAAFEARKQQLKQATRDYDPEMREQILEAFYQEQLQQSNRAAQQAVQYVTAQAWANNVIQQYGLRDDDRMLLGNDPNQMPVIAARIAEERKQHQQLLEQIERERRAKQAQSTVEAQVNRIGGVGGRPAPSNDNIEKGTPQHLRALLAG